MFDPRLIAADILKLRRRRGMLSITLFLTLGGIALVFIVMAVQHGMDPAKYGPAGGLENYREDMSFLGLMALVVGAIVGATAGTQDLESGVFRDLAATGRSRTALFGSRVVGAWAVVVPILALAAGVTGAASVALAGSLAAPSAGAMVAGTAAVMAGCRAQHGRGRGPVDAGGLARTGDRHHARLLPGDPAAAARDELPGDGAPAAPPRSPSTESAICRHRQATYTSRSSPRSSW